ncbi:YciI family protein [Streptomyces sp. NPDC019645]|uniref:YciI family protein n=1 Tax=unclassified Streptomyces TaxID=2593676 RepID=UPI0033C4358B
MFVLELTYTAPLARVEEHQDAHAAWLDALYGEGVLIASGRKNPRDGGVLLAAGVDREGAERIAASDPYSEAGVCAYRITEFIATRTAPALEAYREQPSV